MNGLAVHQEISSARQAVPSLSPTDRRRIAFLVSPSLQAGLLGRADGAVLVAPVDSPGAAGSKAGAAQNLADQHAERGCCCADASLRGEISIARDSNANAVELRKIHSWEQSSSVKSGGWATLPGNLPCSPRSPEHGPKSPLTGASPSSHSFTMAAM